MLECGKNFKGSMKEFCEPCNMLDDEEHCLNYCRRYSDNNCSNTDEKLAFNMIYSRNLDDIRKIIPRICQVWNTKYTHGSMND